MEEPADTVLPQGVGIRLRDAAEQATIQAALARQLSVLGLAAQAVVSTHAVAGAPQRWLRARLSPEAFGRLCAGHATLGLAARLATSADPSGRTGAAGPTAEAEAPGLAPVDPLTRETWAALLAAPTRLDFDSLAELQAHVRVRVHIAQAAARTALAFRTNAAERPAQHWVYDEDRGFLLRPHADLVEALTAATQPEATGRLYDFSCYRATEYVILLGIALEARDHDPALYQRLQALGRHTCIKSGRFHDTFLVEYGAVAAPVPMHYYAPGDRVWFKNPDEASADVEGYEGSWVIYLGGGLFSNFWHRDQPYTLEDKALEIFHWRHGARPDAHGRLWMDEDLVAEQVQRSRQNPQLCRQIVDRMCRYRDPSGVYADGGCIDASREFPLPLTALRLP